MVRGPGRANIQIILRISKGNFENLGNAPPFFLHMLLSGRLAEVCVCESDKVEVEILTIDHPV